MEINGLQPQDVYKSFMKSAVKTDSADKSGSADKTDVSDANTDRVEISSQGSNVNEARELVKNSGISDNSSDGASRAQKIEALKNQVQSGNYSVNSKDVAQSIIKGMYIDKTV
jgi:anti-sigma28 factor (negative regulator of flagellin synthesis)